MIFTGDDRDSRSGPALCEQAEERERPCSKRQIRFMHSPETRPATGSFRGLCDTAPGGNADVAIGGVTVALRQRHNVWIDMARRTKRLFTIGYEQTPSKAVLDELEAPASSCWSTCARSHPRGGRAFPRISLRRPR
jgi:hypothetical protein